MRTLLVALLMVLFTISGSAFANTISSTLTGIITSGSGTGLNGADDIANVFGGGNLSGATVLLSFTYDTALLDAAAASGVNGSSHVVAGSVEAYSDYIADGAISASVMIGRTSVTMSTNNPTYSYGIVAGPNLTLEVIEGGPVTGVFPKLVVSFFTATTGLPVGDLGDSAAIANYEATIRSATLQVTDPTGATMDELHVGGISASPEPMTGLLAGVGLLAASALKRLARPRQ